MNREAFEAYGLSPTILRALKDLAYVEPTEVQRQVIPLILSGQDLVVKSHTGSGKTASFGIPLCELLYWKENKPQALILTPTRELAAQVKDDLTYIGRFKRMKATALFGKQPFSAQKLELKQKSHFVVGTPGRVLDHITKGTMPIDGIRYLVIDEADEMLNRGFLEQVEAIIKHLPLNRMTLMFSATFPREMQQLADRYMRQPQTIEMAVTESQAGSIVHQYFEVAEDQKLSALLQVLKVERPERAMLFCRTKERVDWLCDELISRGFSCDKIHGGMVQEDRFAVMDDFRKSFFRYLIATDVAARGIDVEGITHVINVDLPLERESYVHRAGRTGRAGASGKSFSFVTSRDWDKLEQIEADIGLTMPKEALPSEEELQHAQPAFDRYMRTQPDIRKDKADRMNESIMKLYFNGGKKKKLRAVDFVGTIAKLEGVNADDIGIITIHDNETFVEILNDKGMLVLRAMRSTPVKGKMLKVHEARADR